MKNVLERLDKIVDLAYKVNKKIWSNNYVNLVGMDLDFVGCCTKKRQRNSFTGAYLITILKNMCFLKWLIWLGKKTKSEFDLGKLIRDGGQD